MAKDHKCVYILSGNQVIFVPIEGQDDINMYIRIRYTNRLSFHVT